MENDHDLDKFKENLLNTFDIWKNEKSSIAVQNKLGIDILFAARNGIDLVLKVPKKILEEGRPMIRSDVIDFASYIDGDQVVFSIPAHQITNQHEKNGRFHLGMIEYQETQMMSLSNYKEGIIAMFRGSEVSSLEIK